MARWRQEIDDVDSRKEHVMDAGAPTSGGGSSRNTRAEQRTSHAGLDPVSRGQLTTTSDSGSQETTDLLLYNASVSFSRGPLSPADVEVISATGNILGLGQQTSISFDSPFYRQSGQRAASDDAVSHFIGGGSSSSDQGSFLTKIDVPGPYAAHAGLDMASIEPSLKPVPIYSASVSTRASVQGMSDQQLRSEYNSSVLNILLPECLLNDYQKQLRSEFDSRFKEQIGDAQKDSAGFILNAPLRFLVEKAADHDFGIGYSPEDTVFGSRMVGLEHFNQKDVVKKVESDSFGGKSHLPFDEHGHKIDSGLWEASYENFVTDSWTAPKGTQQTYKIYKRQDIDWDMIRTNPDGNRHFIGKTNREAALAGYAPELPDGSKINLHHIGQNAKGPLVEVSGVLHQKGYKALHGQHGINRGHPEFPVDHGSKWQSDVKEYWKARAKDAR